MKQPENKIKLESVCYKTGEHTWCVVVGEDGGYGPDISNGTSKRSALKAATKRFHRLARDAERMLEKLK